MASEPAIVLSDESDIEPEQPTDLTSRQQVARRGVSSRAARPLRQRARRREEVSTPISIQIAGASRRRTPGTQESVVDLTSIPDEEVIVLGNSDPIKPTGKRKSSPCSLILPKSPVARQTAKCGICFQSMDEKMSCGPCGHVFCEACLRQAVKAQKKCPTCRRGLQLKQIHRIFLNP